MSNLESQPEEMGVVYEPEKKQEEVTASSNENEEKAERARVAMELNKDSGIEIIDDEEK